MTQRTLGRLAVLALSLSSLATLPVTALAAGAGRPPVLTGAAAIHSLARMGGRYCFAGHVHFGSSSGKATKALAKAEAIQDWFDLVDLEYGRQWSSYTLSAAKQVSCANAGTTWGCEVHAIPCSR